MTNEEFAKRHFAYFHEPNGIFKNKLGLNNPKTLSEMEYQIVDQNITQLLQDPPKIKDLSDLSKIHKFLFGPIYFWAGVPRNSTNNGQIPYDLSKQGHDFLPAQAIPMGVNYINGDLATLKDGQPIKPTMYAKLLTNINDLHPFFEGNGRSTKTFLQCLALNHHQELNFDRHQEPLIKLLNQGDNPTVLNKIAKLLDVKPQEPAKLKRKTKLSHHNNDLEV